MDKMKNKVLLILIIILFITTIFRINITINRKEQPVKDDITYWTEDVNPRDGECHCPGGSICYSCQNDTYCKCKITRLDLLDAKQRYESVRQQFDQALGSLNIGD